MVTTPLAASLAGAPAPSCAASFPPLAYFLAQVPDHRAAAGRRYPLGAVLALVCAALLCGAEHLTAIAEWGGERPGNFLARLGFTRGRTPCLATLHTVLRDLNWVALEAQLWLWAWEVEQHLGGDFRAVQARGDVDAVVGRWVLELFGKILQPWHQHRRGELAREPFLAAVQAGQDLLTRWVSLWAWLEVEEGEPTNNVYTPDGAAAERSLRLAVLWRKSSFGYQSDTGEQFVERMLTVVSTLRLQRRNLWNYLVRACEAAVHGHSAPSLLQQASG